MVLVLVEVVVGQMVDLVVGPVADLLQVVHMVQERVDKETEVEEKDLMGQVEVEDMDLPEGMV